MSNTRIVRRKQVGKVEVIVERMSLGQVTDYTVYRVEGESREYVGSGSKREAQRLFDGVKA